MRTHARQPLVSLRARSGSARRFGVNSFGQTFTTSRMIPCRGGISTSRATAIAVHAGNVAEARDGWRRFGHARNTAEVVVSAQASARDPNPL